MRVPGRNWWHEIRKQPRFHAVLQEAATTEKAPILALPSGGFHVQSLPDLEGRRTAAQEVRRAREAATIGKYDMWPRYQGVFVRRPVEHDAGDEAVPEREAVAGRWGLISALTKADGLDKAGKLSTFNARSETAPSPSPSGTPGAAGSIASSPPMPSLNPIGDPALRWPRASPVPMARRWVSPAYGIAGATPPARSRRATPC